MNKYLIATLLLFSLFTACKNEKKPIVSTQFVDSLINNYTQPNAIKANEVDMKFWKDRISSSGTDIVNETKYASTLVGRFHLTGNILDVKSADSILLKLAKNFNNKEAGPYMTLCSHAILHHQFQIADSFLVLAKSIGIKKYENYTTSFDVAFELGRIAEARNNLMKINAENDYGYQFRKSKFAHYNGELDSSILFMQKAYELAGEDIGMKQVALSNVGDLYIHAGKLDKAYDCYVDCIRINAADLHSLMGIGWIALVHDNNPKLAEKIFQFVQTKTKSDEPTFKLIMAAEQSGNKVAEKKYAEAFESVVTNPIYGNMYNKYLIQLYTDVLNNPAKAEALAQKELLNRSTPQTYAWYAYALMKNNKNEDAYKVYQQHISGKPLEGLELYYMGKLMMALNKGYNAQQFFKEAYKNKYDLSPNIVKDLEKEMEG